MRTHTINLFMLGLFILLIQACLPERMAPEPVDVNRPKFLGFSAQDSSAINVSLDHQLTMIFDRKMDTSTFPENFRLESISGPMAGTFKLADNADSVVIFTPSGNMNQAEVYTAYVGGGVRATNGMSRLSPNEPDIPETNWFFTTGQYAQNGFPHIFVLDKNGQQVFLVEKIDSYGGEATVTSESTFGSGEVRITPDGSKMVIANRLSAGTVSIFSPKDMTLLATVNVGVGPEQVFVTNERAYVVNLSGRTISVIDLTSNTELEQFNFSDGFRPRDIVYNSANNKLYISSNKIGEYGKMRVVDDADYTSYYDVENITPTNKKTLDMEITSDGAYIFIAEYNTSSVSVFSTQADTVVATLELDATKNEDGTLSDKYYYLVCNDGNVFKIDIFTRTVLMQLDLERISAGVDVTAADEMLYIATPVDSTVQIVETSTLTRLRQVKVPGTIKRVAASVLNYQ